MNARIGRNIDAALDRRGITPKEAADVAGIDVKTLKRWITGTAGADVGALMVIAGYLNISVSKLLNGEEPPSEAGPAPARKIERPEDKSVPIYDITVSCGPGMTLLEERPIGYMSFPLAELRGLGDPDRMGLVRLSGDSMAPELRDGQLVMIDTSVRPREGLVCARIGEELVLKRLRPAGPGRVELVSVNEEAYPPRLIDIVKEDFDVVGKAVWSGGRLF